MKLRPHPRLIAGPERIAGLKTPPTLPWLQGVDRWTREQADAWRLMPPYRDLDHNEFGYCVLRGRENQMRVLTLAVRWLQCGEACYRDAVINYVRRMNEWEVWSEAFKNWDGVKKEDIFDLNHGESAATLAMAYDWLFASLTDDEKALFREVAVTHVLKPALNTLKKGGAWWYAMAHNNWNGVCAGGLGLLCLALYEESEEARALLSRVEYSLDIFMRAHADNSGASEEGSGYWSYGMRYAGLYLRSREEATGERHPLLDQSWLEQNLTFPLDFSPHGMDVGFGDIPGFGQPLPFHYDIARSRGFDEVIRRIDTRLQWHDDPVPSTNTGTGLNYWNAMEGATSVWLLLHDGAATPAPKVETPAAKIYPGLDWGLLADTMPNPNLYLSVRGGNAGAAHAHDDLLSFYCCVGKEILVGNPKPSKYMPTTFTSRRGEIPDINPQFKNTLLINGVGIYHGTSTDAVEVLRGPGYQGIRMEATTAFTVPRNMSQLDFVGRLFLMLDAKAFLVVDCIASPKGGPFLCEARLHTYAETEVSEQDVLIRGREASLRVRFASNTQALLAVTKTAPTTVRDAPATMLRWCKNNTLTEKAPRTTLFAALLTPGPDKFPLAIREEGEHVVIQTVIGGKTIEIPLRRDLSVHQ